MADPSHGSDEAEHGMGPSGAGTATLTDLDDLDRPPAGPGEFEPWLVDMAAAPAIGVPRHAPLRPGVVIEGRFRIERRLGQGGMGIVYLATDLVLERPVALKLHAVEVGQLSVSRLWREAKAMAKLAHPNVVAIHEVGSYGGRLFIAMEYVDGGTLRSWIAAGDHHWREIVAMFVQAGRGLAAAHAVGFVHRDFKPDNVLIGSDGRPRVADFGVARGRDDPPALVTASADDHRVVDERGRGSSDGDPNATAEVRLGRDLGPLTRTGAAIGTPAYMAPEQFAGIADARADQFGFCVALFEALCGKRPFPGESVMSLLGAIEAGRIEPLPRGLPPALGGVLTRGLARARDDRFRDMPELLGALERVQRRTPARRLAVLAAGAVVGIGAFAARGGGTGSACDRAAAAIETSWGDEAQGRLEQAFAATASGAMPERVRDELDGYAEAWRTRRVEACRATLELGEQSGRLLDARIACLDRRLAEFDAVVGVLTGALPGDLVYAEDAIAAVPPLTLCDDDDALLAAVPLPERAEDRAVVAAVREDIARTYGLRDVGRAREALALAQQSLLDARASGYQPAIAEAALALGRCYGQALRRYDAATALREAFMAAIASGDDAPAFDAAVDLVRWTGEETAGKRESAAWFDAARALAERTGASPLQRARMRGMQARAARARGELAAAERGLAEAIDATVATGDDSIELVELLHQRAAVLSDEGRWAEMTEPARLAFEAALRLRGAEHPLVASTAEQFAVALSHNGDPAGALVMAELAFAIRERAFGPTSLPVSESHNILAIVLADLGRYPEALAHYDAAISISRSIGQDPADEFNALSNAAHVLEQLGRRDDALIYSRRAAELAERHFGDRHYRTGYALLNYGAVLSAGDGLEEALIAYERAAEIFARSLGPTHDAHIRLLLNMAMTKASLRRHDEAIAILDGARAALAGDPGDHGDLPALVEHTCGMIEQERGRQAVAADHYRAALALFERRNEGASDDARVTRYNLGDAELALGHAAAAREALQRLADDEADRVIAPATRAQHGFALARARWAVGEHASARAAVLDIVAGAERDGVDTTTMRAWLRAHPR